MLLPSTPPPEENTPLLLVQNGSTRKRSRATTSTIARVVTVTALVIASLVGVWVASGQLSLWGGTTTSTGGEEQQQQPEQEEQQETKPSRLTAQDVLGWRNHVKPAQSDEPVTPPNIIFILADDLGWNDVGWASDDFAGLTPTLDALKETGVELTSYYTQQLCTPARAALLTGRYPFRIGMQNAAVGYQSDWGLPTEVSILPEFLFEAAGYHSHVVGKWHLGHAYPALLPTARGFLSSFGLLSSQADYVSHASIDDPNFLDFANSWASGGPVTDKQQERAQPPQELPDGQGYACMADKNGTHSTSLFTDRALTIADEWNERGQDAPLFLYMAYQNPHFPPQPDPNWNYDDVKGVLDSMDTEVRRLAARLVHNLDTEVNRLLVGLQERGVLENSVIIFTSDNGPCRTYGLSAYPLRGSKNYTFEGGSKVRAFATSPIFPARVVNTTYDGLFHVTDWVPTLMEMAAPGWSRANAAQLGLDGMNQLQVFMGGSDGDLRDEVVYNLQQAVDDDGNAVGLYGAIRQGDWKYILNEDCQVWYDFASRYNATENEEACSLLSTDCLMLSDPRSFLFNLRDDPNETTDLSDQFPKLVSFFQNRMQALADAGLVTPVSNGKLMPDVGSVSVWGKVGCMVPWLEREGGDLLDLEVGGVEPDS